MKKKQTKFNEDELFDILAKPDMSIIKKFIEKYNILSVDRDGRNILLNLIIEHKSKYAINILEIYDELDINQQDRNGFSALHFAVQEELLEVVEKLVNKGAIIDIVDNNGNTPLWRGAFDKVDNKILLFLIENGADIHKKNKSGISPKELLTDS
jgi:ankyrin repeat protein